MNDLIRHEARLFRNATLADWHAASGGPGPQADGAQATPRGMRVSARAIAARLR